jgi:hypothetical protein
MTIVPIAPPSGGSSWLDIIDRAGELSEVIANTEFVPKGLRGNQPAILAAVLYGHEVGLGPMQSLAKISVIDGRPTLAAEAMRALVRRAGHEIWIEESTTTRAVVAGRRRGERVTQRVTWTLDDAKRARLAGRQNWQTYPRQMLLARAWAELCRQVFDDAIGGLAATEEIEETVEDGPQVETVGEVEAPKTTRRRRRLTTAPEPEPAAELEGQPEPEQSEPEPMSDPQRRKMMALFRERGVSDRDHRIDIASTIAGRPIKSSSELSSSEASAIIDTLENLAELPAHEVTHAAQSSIAQRGTVLAMMSRLGIAGTDAVAYLRDVTGRNVTSSGELTAAEAEQVIQALAAEQQPAEPSGLPPLPESEQAVLDELGRYAEPQDL